MILQNQAYIGRYIFNKYSYSSYHHFSGGEIRRGGRRGANPESDWIIHEDHHEAIIDRETFEKAQRIFERNRRSKPPYKREENPYLLSCKLRCSRCGSILHGVDNRKYRYYECARGKREKTCEGTTVREDRVLQLIVESIERDYLQPPGACIDLWQRLYRGETVMDDDLPKGIRRLKKSLYGERRTSN